MSVKQRILVELDCLIDTPMAVLAQHWPEKFAVEDIGDYRKRKDDFFWKRWDIPKEEWLEKYQGRNETILYDAVSTELMVNIREVVGVAAMRGVTTPVFEPVELILNTYPYNLSEEVQREMVTVLRELLLDSVKVSVTEISTQDLTPQLIKESYEVVFTRDLIGWLTVHPEVGEHPIARVVFNYPAVIHTEDPELIDKAIREKSNPFTTAKATMAPFITMEALDVQLFCMLDPKELDL